MATRIRVKRGTSSQITGYTGPHYVGELAYATDTEAFYVSNGTAFIPVGGSSETPTLQSVTDAGAITTNDITTGSVTSNGNFLITGNDSTVQLRGSSVDFNIQTTAADNVARIATTTGGSARLDLYNHIPGFNGALEFRATSWENDALVISGGTPNTTKFLVSRDPNAATLQVTGESYFTGNVGIGTTAPASTLHVAGTIQQTVDAATNQYPIQLYNDHAGTDYYLLRQRVVDTGSKVRTGLGITGAPDAAFVLGSQTDQIIKFENTGSIVNVATISATSTMKINADEIRTGDTTSSSAAHFNITSTNSSTKAALGLKQGASASNLMIDIRNSSGISTMGLTSEGGFYFKDSNLVGRYAFDHDYLPSTVDGLTTGLEFRTENASGVLTPFGYIDVTNDDRILQKSSMRLSVGQSNPAEIMRLQSDGNVGTGTTAPTSKMHINGNAMAQLRLEQQGGPANTADSKGAVGDIAYDDLYFYIKTGNGWGRVPLDFGF